jgi:hypothetical protein
MANLRRDVAVSTAGTASQSTRARFRAHGQIRNTIAKPFPDHCRDFKSHMSMSQSSAADGARPDIALDVNAFWENQSLRAAEQDRPNVGAARRSM